MNPRDRLPDVELTTSLSTAPAGRAREALIDVPSHEKQHAPAIARFFWISGYFAAAIALFFCYLRVSYTQAVTSDGASNALQAWDLLHGNVLLHGWTLSDVSFYTTELPEYVLVEIFRGLGPANVHVCAAISYTLLVLLAGLLAKGRTTGWEGLLRAMIASGIMIAPEVGPGAFILLLSPDHTGTGVPLLLIWLLLEHAPRKAWVPVFAGLALTWAAIADSIVFLMGAFPIALVCGLSVYRHVRRRHEPARAHWFELSLGGAAIGSVAAAFIVVKVIAWAGGYSMEPVLTGVASPVAWWSNLRLTVEGVLSLFGADFFGRSPGMFMTVAVIHLAGVALVIWAFCLGLRRLRSGGNLIDAALTIAIAVNVAVYMFSNQPHTQWDTREMAVVLPYGAVLAGRLLAGPLSHLAIKPVLAAGAICYVLALGFALTQPVRPAHDQDLAAWLMKHRLTCGLGSYVEGNSTTLDSSGQIQLRAPVWTQHGTYSGAHESKNSWFDASACEATFVVSTQQDGEVFYIPRSWATAAFGNPAHTYVYHSFTIWVWDKNLFRSISHYPPPG